MKCTLCGNNKLKEIQIIDDQVNKLEGYVEQTVKSYACEKCGHVELFYDFKNKKSSPFSNSALGG